MRTLEVKKETFHLKSQFKISGYTISSQDVIHARIYDEGATGVGEASGIYYLGETAESMIAQLDSVRADIEAGASRRDLLDLLPRGGARNAVDCALWDLECKQKGVSVWQLTGINPKVVETVMTVGIDSLDEMVRQAVSIPAQHIKVKLDDDMPLEKMKAIRQARPEATILVDVNQGWDMELLLAMAPEFRRLGIDMIEQPLPRGHDGELSDFESPVALCADESCLDSSELVDTVGKYDVVNIKLDKTGGLTEALNVAHIAHRKGMKLMVGNMCGTSLAMAPGFVVAQLCRFIDLDGATFLTEDRNNPLDYSSGQVSGLTPALWG